MIYVNETRVDLDGDSKHAKEFQEARKLIIKRGFPVIVRINPSRIKQVRTTKGMQKEWNKQYIKYTATIDTPSGSETWTYTKTPPVKDKNGNLQFRNNGRWMFKEFFSLQKKDMDFIFWLEYKCPLIKSGVLYIENVTAEATKEVEGLADDADVRYLIFGRTSPLAESESMLRTLASAWGIRNVFDKHEDGEYVTHLDVIRRDLFKTLKAEEKKSGEGRGFAEFLKEAKVGELTKRRAIVQQAMDKFIIGYDSSSHSWCFLDGEKNFMNVITQLTPQEVSVKENALFDYLLIHEGPYQRLLDAVQKSVDEETVKALITEEEEENKEKPMEEWTWGEITKRAKELDISPIGIKKDKLIEKIRAEEEKAESSE